MSSADSSLSVIIRARDEAASIGRTLALLEGQDRPPEEVIVVDSGSSDDTVAIARAAGARVIEIDPERFSFGGALNTGCAAASGELLVALSAHAFPRDPGWLGRMATAIADPEVACASGADYDAGGNPLTAPVRQDAAAARRNRIWGYSNGAGGFRAELWRRRGFRSDMPATEDKEWARYWLDRGYVTLLDPELAVDHDHTHDPVRDVFRRARIEAVGYSMFTEYGAEPIGSLAREWWSPPSSVSGLARWRVRASPWRLAALAGRAAAARTIRRAPRPSLAVLTDLYPVVSQTFVANEVAELRRRGYRVAIEADHRPPRAAPTAAEPAAHWMEDDGRLGRWAAAARLAAARPRAVRADRAARPRWAGEEEVRPLRALARRATRMRRRGVDHMHVHFAAAAALDAMRISALTGIPYSLTAHAYDIFERPANLREKLERATFATTGCEYNRVHLRSLVGAEAAERIHVVVMGIDTAVFRRTTPYPGGRHVVAVGRLVEKKGFEHLLEAVALLEGGDRADQPDQPDRAVERLTIVGDGPLRGALEAAIARLGLGERVTLAGELAPAGVRGVLESADLLAAPCVVAANGDRDSMPVVVKEAMAMELPVIASHEVGLPELVQPEFGRLVAPGDPEALADGIAELLALPAERRAEMGAAGRRWAAEHCSLGAETARLAALIEATAGSAAQ